VAMCITTCGKGGTVRPFGSVGMAGSSCSYGENQSGKGGR
jgi:hypothetical protein